MKVQVSLKARGSSIYNFFMLTLLLLEPIIIVWPQPYIQVVLKKKFPVRLIYMYSAAKILPFCIKVLRPTALITAEQTLLQILETPMVLIILCWHKTRRR